MGRTFRLGALSLALLVAGCATQTYTPAPIYDPNAQEGPVSVTSQTYVVAQGDTIYSIATRHGIDPYELMRANGITDPTSVAVGTELKLTAQRTQPVTDLAREASAQEVTTQVAPSSAVDLANVAEKSAKPIGGTYLIWPVEKAPLLADFKAEGSKGIQISGRMGDNVVAAADGQVLYTGNSVSGYGNLVILRHAQGLVTVYGHNSDIIVKRGASVKAGDKIAHVGSSGDSKGKPNLVFEVRYNDRPVDPVEYLP